MRPEWQDVQPLVQKLDAIPETAFWRRFWYELPHQHTESWYVRQALEGNWPDEPEYGYVSRWSAVLISMCMAAWPDSTSSATAICAAMALMKYSTGQWRTARLPMMVYLSVQHSLEKEEAIF